MKGKTWNRIAIWNSIVCTLFTAALVFFAVFPRSPVQPVASPSQPQSEQQGSWVQSLEHEWRGSLRYVPDILRYVPAIIVGSMTILAALLNLRAAQIRGSVESGDHCADQSIQDHPQLKQIGHVALSIEPSKPPPDEGIAVGTRVRLRGPLTDADRHQFPGWIDEMDASIGQDFVVRSCASNGLLQLEGLRPKVCVAWVEPSSQVARVRAI